MPNIVVLDLKLLEDKDSSTIRSKFRKVKNKCGLNKIEVNFSHIRGLGNPDGIRSCGSAGVMDLSAWDLGFSHLALPFLRMLPCNLNGCLKIVIASAVCITGRKKVKKECTLSLLNGLAKAPRVTSTYILSADT